MRIMYVLSGTGTKGGATKSFLSMADAVARAGNEIAVVVPDNNGVTPLLRERGWKVLVVPYVFSALPNLSLSVRDIVRFFPRLVKGWWINRKAHHVVEVFAHDFLPDIIHENTSVTDIGHVAAGSLNVPHLIHVREYGWKDFRLVLPNIRKRLTANNTYIAAITGDLALLRGKGLPPDHVRVVYNGVVDTNAIKYKAEKSAYFLYAGRIELYKGTEDLVEAYTLYAREEIENGYAPLRLKLAGECRKPAHIAALQDRLESAGVSQYVDWLGARDDMENLYYSAVATVIPSRFEGFGRVMPEAMAAGSLCIVRNAGGLSEQLTNGIKITGEPIALDFHDVDGLYRRLKEVAYRYRQGGCFQSGGEYKMMIQRSQDVISRLYTCDSNGYGILDFYRYIIDTTSHSIK